MIAIFRLYSFLNGVRREENWRQLSILRLFDPDYNAQTHEHISLHRMMMMVMIINIIIFRRTPYSKYRIQTVLYTLDSSSALKSR